MSAALADAGVAAPDAAIEVDIEVEGERHAVEVGPDGCVKVDGHIFATRVERDGALALVSAGQGIHVVGFADARTAIIDGRRVAFRIHHLSGAAGAPREAGGGHGPVRAPMAGRIERITVVQGQDVEAGQVLFVLEAMKMRNEVKAPGAGRVVAVHVEAGSTVDAATAIVELAQAE